MIVTFSDGLPGDVTRLLPWAFDDLRDAILGPDFSHIYRFKVVQPSGRAVDDYINTLDLTTEPQPPAIAIDADPSGWANYRYQTDAWAWRQAEIIPRLKAYETARRQMIIDSQPPELRQRIQTPGDYAVIIRAAPTAEVTIDLLADVARRRFKFRFDDLGLIEAMEKYGLIKEGGTGTDGFDLCRGWEGDAMIALGESPPIYFERPLVDRAHVVWLMIRSNIWQALNFERDKLTRGR